MIASSMIQLGLSWWQAWLFWIGYGIAAPFIVANSRPGGIFHITFPIVSRASFGIWGSLWCVFNRGAMAWQVTSREYCITVRTYFDDLMLTAGYICI